MTLKWPPLPGLKRGKNKTRMQKKDGKVKTVRMQIIMWNKQSSLQTQPKPSPNREENKKLSENMDQSTDSWEKLGEPETKDRRTRSLIYWTSSGNPPQRVTHCWAARKQGVGLGETGHSFRTHKVCLQCRSPLLQLPRATPAQHLRWDRTPGQHFCLPAPLRNTDNAGQSSMASALRNIFKEILRRDFMLSHPWRYVCHAELSRNVALEQTGKLKMHAETKSSQDLSWNWSNKNMKHLPWCHRFTFCSQLIFK